MDDCVLWTGALNSQGYPVTWFEGKTVYAHRLIAKASKSDVVLHTCDTPACVNPNHLVLGTHADNSKDMVKKNRQAKGELCGNSKTNAEQVLLIRELHGKLSSRKVGLLFKMSKTNILDIWNRNIWTHI